MVELIQASELQILVLAVALTPVMAWAYRELDRPGKGWLAAGITAIGFSYVTTIVEGFVAENLFNHLEHLSIAISGICFMVFCIMVLRWQRDGGFQEPKR